MTLNRRRQPGAPYRVSMSASVLVLAAGNLLFNRIPGASVAIGIGLTGAMAVIARASGLGRSYLGLTGSAMRSGMRWGGGFAILAAGAYAVALSIPAARQAIAGPEGGSWVQVLLRALVVIPLGTVIPEEFAFRGVLGGLLQRRSRRLSATLVSSALFGLWHVAPAMSGGAANKTVDDVVGRGTFGAVVRVAATVLFTAAAGVMFSELRIRSGSLLAPMLAHWSVNGLGVVFVELAGCSTSKFGRRPVDMTVGRPASVGVRQRPA